MLRFSIISQKSFKIIWGAIILVGLYLTSLYNYLLFHSLAEIFSIIVIWGMFLIVWNSRKYMEEDFLVFIAIAYLFIGLLDLLHTLSYKGMNIFTDYDFYANQLWIAARYLESLTLGVAFVFFHTKKKLNPILIFALYSLITAAIISSIFSFKIFPICFVEGTGLTPFKKVSEYIISFILLADILLLLRHKHQFENKIFKYLIISIIFTIISELAFTFYIDNYGFSNLVGHFFKIFSFYLIYKAIIETGIVRPYDIIFRELKQREEALRASEANLRQANETKNKFFSIIAHDLKNPFSSVYASSEFLHEQFDQIDEKRKKKIIIRIYNSSKNLYKLLENLLQWSRSQTGKMEFSPQKINLKYIVNDTLMLLASNAKSKEIKMTSTLSDSMVYADVNMVTTVIRNLISNAIKFTSDGGTVEITSAKKDGWTEISVIDDGMGISKADMEKLFRIDCHHTTIGTSNEKGTGLGLILSKEFVEKHGGKIWVESEEGKGSAFKFTLPNKNETLMR